MPERLKISDLDRALRPNNKDIIAQRHLARYQFATELVRPEMVVVDIACGTGYGSKMLARTGCKVFAIDISSEAIQFAKKHNNHPNITWLQGDILDFAKLIREKVDAIVCFETLEHLADQHVEILRSFKEKLHAGSPLIGSIPLNHPDTIWHRKIFNFEEREQLFLEVFERIEYSDANASIIVGWN